MTRATLPPTGQPGEVWLSGPMIMNGYNNLPEETAAALTPDGYFKTGDLGLVDAEGYLHITGRKKDQINVSGEKASPREIEELLNQHPAVAETRRRRKEGPQPRRSGGGIHHPSRGANGQAGRACANFCREHGLAQWKIPRDIQFVADLPRSPTGKVLKRVLVEQLSAT